MQRAHAFDLLRVVFGRAKMETLESYRAWCEGAGLAVASAQDISQQTAPTFAHWRANAERYSQEVAEMVGEQALADFVQACSELEKMWADQVLGYGLLVADAP
jgi:cyclopropane fatty-acyl-phospholipid synthase-like methyltransferase